MATQLIPRTEKSTSSTVPIFGTVILSPAEMDSVAQQEAALPPSAA
jgi:hypothetical protein